MTTTAELLYDALRDPEAVLALVGKAEDSDLDCKQWLGDERSKRAMLAKAVCGFANGDGGIVLLGLRAEARGKDEADVIKGAAFFPDPEAVKAKALAIIQSEIEPLVESVRATAVQMNEIGEGIVSIFVPPSNGLPHRSKQDWKFHLRSGSATQNMPMSVLADRFGRRPHADLRISVGHVSHEDLPGIGRQRARVLEVFVENRGRGLARFPALLLAKDSAFIPLHNPYAEKLEYLWPLQEAEQTWRTFRGGSEAVVYPGEKLRVCRLVQRDASPTETWPFFQSAIIVLGTLCDGSPLEIQEFSIPAVIGPQ